MQKQKLNFSTHNANKAATAIFKIFSFTSAKTMFLENAEILSCEFHPNDLLKAFLLCLYFKTI